MSDGPMKDPGSDGVRADELIRELVADLEPVKPIPPVRADEAIEPDPETLARE